MYILCTNDDGVNSEGLRELRKGLAGLGRIVVVAPDREQSASGHSQTLHRPLRVHEVSHDTFIVDGTPTDCVLLTIREVIKEKPSLVVSGINKSPNLGDDVTYSGTVCAAMEGAIWGIPSFAISMASYTQLDFSLAAKVANQLAHLLLRNHILPTGTFLNVNVPAIPESETPRFAITRLGKRLRREEVVRRDDPKGRPYFWIGRRPQMANPEDGTDFSAIEKRMVSITPLQLDLTDHSFLPRLQGLVSNLKIE